jgi:hypothetical protein
MFDYQTKSQNISSSDAFHVSKLLFDNVEIIIPQDEVVSIESIHELNPADSGKRFIGEIFKQNFTVPVYCLSDSMELLACVSEVRSKCVVIRHGDVDFSLLCQDIQNVVLYDMRLQKVPRCMTGRNMPVTHLCLYKEVVNLLNLGLVTNASCLYEYIMKA